MGKSSRKNRENTAEVDKRKNSTVFCDPKKKESVEETSKKSNKKKIITVVVVALVFVLVVLPWGIVKIFGENHDDIGKSIPTVKQRVTSAEADIDEVSEKAKSLFAVKDNDPTNIKVNEHIANLVGMTTYCGKHSIEVYEGDSGYVMRFVFEKPHSTSMNTVFYDMMLNYTVVMMALVNDIEAVEWTCPSLEGGQAISERITLENIEEYLNGSPKEYAKSEKSVQYMLTEYGLNDLTDQ